MKTAACMYNGQTFGYGDTFRSNDSCHECTCNYDGELECTPYPCCKL